VGSLFVHLLLKYLPVTPRFFLLLTGTLFYLSTSSQTPIDQKFDKAYGFSDNKEFDSALVYFTQLKQEINTSDTNYKYAVMGIASAYYFGGIAAKKMQDWPLTKTRMEAFLNSLEEYKKYLANGFFDKKFFAIQHLVLANFEMKNEKDMNKYRDMLYKAHREKELLEGINHSFNYDFFKEKGTNVWGYEYYPELGDPGTEGSFSKIVYYVYSTKPDGSDDQQLFRLHVLKIHKIDAGMKVDYVLTKRLETAKHEASGTLWSYTYESPVDREKLKKDILEVLKGNLQPETKTIINKNN
jgi:hypothetical protein